MTFDVSVYPRPSGGLRELVLLFSPVLLMTFSTCLIVFVEKLLLGRFSTEAMEVAVTSTYACQVFQAPCVALAMMAQVFVGRWHGAGEFKAIGPSVWQFIWFSCLSPLVIVPCSLLYGSFYFHGAAIEGIGLSYFYFLVAISFLFPLGVTLSCFYLGRGKTGLVLLATIGAQLLKLLTAYLFIFGWKWFPSFGLMGGVISTFIAQGSFCLFLLFCFLSPKQAAMYHSHTCRFQPKLFWDCIRSGLLRAMNRALSFASWAMVSRLMTARGGDHFLVLSIGGTLNLFLPFLGEALCQAQTTLVSQILGAKQYPILNRAFRSGMFLFIAIILPVSVPFILFPSATFYWLFPDVYLAESTIRTMFLGIYVCFMFYVLICVPISYIFSFKDMKFSFFMGAFTWINCFLWMYWMVEVVKIRADQFWFALSFMHLTTAVLYLLRMRWLMSKSRIERIPQGVA